MKINVVYVNDHDDYKDLYTMSRMDLIKIIKDNDKVIDDLNRKIARVK